MADISILERRRIEAEILGEVYRVILARDGQVAARDVIGATCSASAIAQGKGFSQGLPLALDLEDFAAILPNWSREDALQIDVLVATPERLEFNVTRCRYSEVYAEMGLAEIGDLLSCNRDGDFCIGYNPQIKLTRTQTIMQGASHCDFRYCMAPSEER